MGLVVVRLLLFVLVSCACAPGGNSPHKTKWDVDLLASYVVVQRGYCAQCATALKFGGRTTEPDDGRGNSLLASASATSTSSLRLFGLFGPARRLAMGKGGSPRVEYPCSSRRSLPILIFMAVATALSALRMASLQPAPTAPHNVGDFLRQPSAPLKESDISLEFEDAFVRGSPEDEPPRVDSWLIKGHHLPEPTGRIPKRINKIFFQKDGNFRSQLYREKDGISDLIKAAHQSWTDKNPGYKVHYYNIPAARKYLQTFYHPVFLRMFDCIEAFAGKSDLFRMALLYREGGWTSDWKQVCLEDGLLDAIASKMDFFVAADRGNLKSIKDRCAQNSFVGVVPQHPVVANYLKRALLNVQGTVYGNSPLFPTGPCLLGWAVRLHDEDFGDTNYQGPTFFDDSHFHWNERAIVKHKCEGCGQKQTWTGGNDYNTLYNNQVYYCQDAASIFKTLKK